MKVIAIFAATLSLIASGITQSVATERSVLDDATAAVVRVVFRPPVGPLEPQGSGFFVNTEGHLVTAHHVIEDYLDGMKLKMAGALTVGVARQPLAPDYRRNDLDYLNVDVIGLDPDRDLAVLKVRDLAGRKVHYLRINPARPVEAAAVAATGFPFPDSAARVHSFGWVSSAWYRMGVKGLRPGEPVPPEKSRPRDVYIVQIPMLPGMSGGPVYNASNGAVTGIVMSSVRTPVMRRRVNTLDTWDQLPEVVYSAGQSLIIPAEQVVQLLKRHSVPWHGSEK